MKIIVSKFTKNEFDEACAFYEIEMRGLGGKFKKEIKQSLFRIQLFPKACLIEKDEVRRNLLHKFPYKILFSIQDDCIVVLAIAHQHRHPTTGTTEIKTYNKVLQWTSQLRCAATELKCCVYIFIIA